MVSGVRQEQAYIAISYLHETENYPIQNLCALLHLNRSSYYKWKKRIPSVSQITNEQIIIWIKELYEEQNGILGYRQMTIAINRLYNTHYNQKRIHRLMQLLHIKSVCRASKKDLHSIYARDCCRECAEQRILCGCTQREVAD